MRDSIYVLSNGNGWKVLCKHCSVLNVTDSVTTDTQREAIAIARGHVADLPAGALAQIRLQNGFGRFRDEWTYGKDPFPPKG